MKIEKLRNGLLSMAIIILIGLICAGIGNLIYLNIQDAKNNSDLDTKLEEAFKAANLKIELNEHSDYQDTIGDISVDIKYDKDKTSSTIKINKKEVDKTEDVKSVAYINNHVFLETLDNDNKDLIVYNKDAQKVYSSEALENNVLYDSYVIYEDKIELKGITNYTYNGKRLEELSCQELEDNKNKIALEKVYQLLYNDYGYDMQEIKTTYLNDSDLYYNLISTCQ